MPFPKTDSFNSKKYGNIDSTWPIQASRGCPYRCTFCSVTAFHKHQIRFRPVKKIIEEIKQKGHKHVFFIDDNLTCNYDFAKELFTALKPLKIKWSAQCSILIAEHEELLELARDSGCYCFYVGLESINQESLDSINKNFNQVEKYKRALKKIYEYDIAVILLLILGFDCDTKKIFDDTLKFLDEVKVLYASFGIVTPFPGTQLYEQLKKENRIIDYNWDHYDPGRYCVFQPRNMTPQELLEGRKRLLLKYYSPCRVLKRILSYSNKNFLINTYLILVDIPYINFFVVPIILKMININERIKGMGMSLVK